MGHLRLPAHQRRSRTRAHPHAHTQAPACRAVLVGDPQQLPATVLSRAARAGLLERSLFERLQRQGHPCTMLSVQYRMHAAIRSFPSAFFYQNRLQDACALRRCSCCAVLRLPMPCMTRPVLSPTDAGELCALRGLACTPTS